MAELARSRKRYRQGGGTALKKHGFEVTRAMDLDGSELDIKFRDFIARYGNAPRNRLLFYFAGLRSHYLPRNGAIRSAI